MKNKVVTILIPCLNEKRTIGLSVLDAKRNAKKYFQNNFEIIVADNGSNDGTLDILKNLKGIKVLNVPVKGYGAALHFGILNAKGDFVIFADADLSYPFSNLTRFKNKLKNNHDLVLGSRFKGSIERGSMPLLHRYFGTPFLTLLIRLIYGMKVTDCNSGMRMVKKEFYKKLNMRNSGMEWASELLCKTAIKEGKYSEIPIKFMKDKRGRNAHLSTWADGWRHLKAILFIKPVTMIYLATTSIIFASIVYKFSFSLTFFFLLVAQILVLSYFTLKLLETIIEKTKNKISNILLEFKIVPLIILATIIQFGLLFLISDTRMGTKLVLTSVLGITYMWAFLIETIKTHLVNKL